YWIYVDAAGGESAFDIAWSTAAPVVAGSCDMPYPLVDGMTRTGDTNAGALDNGFGSCAGGNGLDRVYSFTLMQANTVTVTVANATFPTALFIKSADCNIGSEVACIVGNGGAAITKTLAAGPYFVFVDGPNGATGTYDITLNLAPPPPPNDS